MVKWIRKWVREESFWKDVTTRTLSALLALAISYLFALAAGYVGAPVRVMLLWWLVGAVAGFAVTYATYRHYAKRWAGNGDLRGLIVLPLGIVVVLAFVGFVVVTLLKLK